MQTLSPSINTVMNVLDKASAERETLLKRFCLTVDKDIAELGRELREIKNEINVCRN